jgi:actin-related protein 10
MASNILVTGGTAMLPGFASRLSLQLKAALADPRFVGEKGRRRYDPYANIRLLHPFLSVINESTAHAAEGKGNRAPAFSPALLPWVGGSLSG